MSSCRATTFLNYNITADKPQHSNYSFWIHIFKKRAFQLKGSIKSISNLEFLQCSNHSFASPVLLWATVHHQEIRRDLVDARVPYTALSLIIPPSIQPISLFTSSAVSQHLNNHKLLRSTKVYHQPETTNPLKEQSCSFGCGYFYRAQSYSAFVEVLRNGKIQLLLYNRVSWQKLQTSNKATLLLGGCYKKDYFQPNCPSEASSYTHRKTSEVKTLEQEIYQINFKIYWNALAINRKSLVDCVY